MDKTGQKELQFANSLQDLLSFNPPALIAVDCNAASLYTTMSIHSAAQANQDHMDLGLDLNMSIWIGALVSSDNDRSEFLADFIVSIEGFPYIKSQDGRCQA